MANTWKTLSDGDLVKKSLSSFTNKLKFLKTINTTYEKDVKNSERKNGGVILIKNPNEFTVRSGAVMSVNDVAETTQSLSVLTERGVDLEVSSIDHSMSVEQFETNIIEPAMTKLASYVEYDVLSNVYKDVFNLTGTPATTPASLVAVLNANARLSQELAPTNDRHLLMDSLAMAATVNGVGAYFHKASELERAFAEGYIGEAAGLKWWESNMTPTHTNGTRDDTTPVCNTSTGITSGTATITTTGADGTMTVGDVFTIADVYAINRETKQRYAHLQQFVITAAITNDGTDVWSVSPTPVTSGASQNIEIVSAGAGKAIVNVAAGGSGAASAVYTQNLAYHKDAFTFASVMPYIDESQKMSSAVKDNIAMRIWRDGNITNNRFPLRIDVLYGYKTIRPQWAVRVRG
ncbi:P22 phage major capsid protein family protein [Candidatus Magnetobacterium casense]|uniref:Coat protein n=1 Tax=Candidatus Magnetobacterium casense TaxID=1455061 RepID=A0ABS6RV04_9BACT|nr:P22 phage major capsid protein family protein [Candidatus Magnetobacterium casensis]MBV6340453.1 hypothetical protein [Candidatus Magnetobacterium casensis]